MQRFPLREAVLFVLLVGIAVLSRLLPHAPNFTAIMAVGLLAAVVFPSRILAAAVPMTAMVISDAFIGGYDARLMLAVYGAMVLPLVMRPLLSGRMMPLRVAGASVVCSVAFFVITNAAVWAFGSMYELSATGFAACFAAAVPFLKYQLAGDLSYSLALFGFAAAVRGMMASETPGLAKHAAAA